MDDSGGGRGVCFSSTASTNNAKTAKTPRERAGLGAMWLRMHNDEHACKNLYKYLYKTMNRDGMHFTPPAWDIPP